LRHRSIILADIVRDEIRFEKNDQGPVFPPYDRRMRAPFDIEPRLAPPPAPATAFVQRMARRRGVPLESDLATLYFDISTRRTSP
jgi:hypothetical protein